MRKAGSIPALAFMIRQVFRKAHKAMSDALTEFLSNLYRDMEKPREPAVCRCCGDTWVPKGWNFHGLCNTCFSEFDKQKMAGRLAALEGRGEYFESVGDWIANRRKK
jgi:hypothetical protein